MTSAGKRGLRVPLLTPMDKWVLLGLIILIGLVAMGWIS